MSSTSTSESSGHGAKAGGRAPRKTAAERRADIAHAAEAIARESGLVAVTMRSVAARVGVTPTLVVHHIDSMDHLVADAYEAVASAELDELREFAVEQDAADRLDVILSTVLDGTRSDVTRVWVEAWGLGRSNPILAQRVREQMDEWRAFFAELIAAGVEAGRYRVSDSVAVAGQLLAMVDGLNAHSLVGWESSERAHLLRRAADAMLSAPRGVEEE